MSVFVFIISQFYSFPIMSSTDFTQFLASQASWYYLLKHESINITLFSLFLTNSCTHTKVWQFFKHRQVMQLQPPSSWTRFWDNMWLSVWVDKGLRQTQTSWRHPVKSMSHIQNETWVLNGSHHRLVWFVSWSMRVKSVSWDKAAIMQLC